MKYCTFCKKDIHPLGLASHRAGHRRKLTQFATDIRSGNLGMSRVSQMWDRHGLSGAAPKNRGESANEVERQLKEISYY